MPGILVGLDGSHYSERALEWAAREAAIRNAPLRVLAVHTVPVGWSGRAVPYPEDAEIVVSTKAAAQELTDKVLAGIGSARPNGVTVEAGSGIPGDVLVQGSRGRRHDRPRRARRRRLRQAAAGIGQRPGGAPRALPGRDHPASRPLARCAIVPVSGFTRGPGDGLIASRKR